MRIKQWLAYITEQAIEEGYNAFGKLEEPSKREPERKSAGKGKKSLPRATKCD